MAAETVIQIRRGLAATWTGLNPTLAAGELGVDIYNLLNSRVAQGTVATIGSGFLTPSSLLVWHVGQTGIRDARGDAVSYHNLAEVRAKAGIGCLSSSSSTVFAGGRSSSSPTFRRCSGAPRSARSRSPTPGSPACTRCSRSGEPSSGSSISNLATGPG